MIRRLLPASVVVFEARECDWEADLLPEEAGQMASSGDARRREFAAGRACARRALAELGWPGAAVLAGPAREPLWPPGIVGSITHCPGYCAAAVARESDLRGLGIDAERNTRLPPEVLRLICTERERREMLAIPGASAPALYFSAKEAVYKAWYPLARRRLGHLDAEVELDPRSGRFRASLLVEPPPACDLPGAAFEGRFGFTSEHVFTVVAVQRSG